MEDDKILYKILDFEVNWNKFHLNKNSSYIFRIQQLNNIFEKLEISTIQLIPEHTNSFHQKNQYNFIKTGHFLNYVCQKNLDGISYRFKNIIQNTQLISKYPHYFDLEFNNQLLFVKIFSLRCSIYKLQTKFENTDLIENIELDIEKIIYKKIISNIENEVKILDLYLHQFLNPYNKTVNEKDILHATVDFSRLV